MDLSESSMPLEVEPDFNTSRLAASLFSAELK